MDGGAMSLSNLNDAQSMSSATAAATTGKSNNDVDDVVLASFSNDNQLIDAINLGVGDSATEAIITSLRLSLMLSKQHIDNFEAKVVTQENDTRFLLNQIPINGKFPCRNAKPTVAPAYELHAVQDAQCWQMLERIQHDVNADLSLKKFPTKVEAQNKSKFPLKRKEIVENVMDKEIKSMEKNMSLQTNFTLKEQVVTAKTLRFPVLLAQMNGFSNKSSYISSSSTAITSCPQTKKLSYKTMQTTSCQLPITKSTSMPPAMPPSDENFSQKFPIIKKQFFKFPMSHQHNLKGTKGEEDEIENTKLMTSQNDEDDHHDVDNERHFDEDIATTLQQIQGQTLNLNAQKGNIPALNARSDGAIDAIMPILLLDIIKHQQAENFNDAVKITKTISTISTTTSATIDAIKSSKNKQENEKITEQQNKMKLLPEIFERAAKCEEQIMTKDKPTDPTSKNLAHQEQSSSFTEHNFDICEVNTNNNFRSKRETSKQPDNNHHHHHHHQQIYSQQHRQPLLEQSEQTYTNPKSSDVHESSSEPEALHENTLLRSVSSLLVATPVSPSLPPSPPLSSSTKSAVAPCTTPASLAVSTPAHKDDDESSAAPNIELSVYGTTGDVVVIGDILSRCVNDDDISENENIFKDYESECAEILTDVIDLIEQTTAALLITGNLLTEARESKQKHGENDVKETQYSWRSGEKPEVLLYEAEAEAMTVTKQSSEHSQAGEVCANREQKLLNDTSSVVNELDEMKFEMNRVKGALPNAGSSGSLTSTTPRTSDNSMVSTTSRIHDVPTTERNSLTTKTPRVSDISSTRRESLSRLHNTGNTAATTTGSNLMPTASRLSDITSPKRSLSIAGSLVNFKGSPSQDSMEYVLPERTRLRRQRRMRSQESVEESPEDVIERLNNLKARISGALSEVKSVIKQYSTESEADSSAAGIERPTLSRSPSSISLTHQESVSRSPSGISLTQRDSVIHEEEPHDETAQSAAPVQFRFIRKVRRRSIFNEEDEYQAEKQEKEATKDQPNDLDKSAKETPKENGFAKENGEMNLKEDIQKSAEPKEMVTKTASQEKSKDPINLKIDFLHKVAEELNEKPATESIDLKQSIQMEAKSNTTAILTEDKPRVPLINTILASLDEETAKEPRKSQEPNQPTETHDEESGAAKPKKKIVLQKVKSTTNRRASIAAVEGSKIEPPVQSTLPLTIKAQRRPSDSEAVVKKKSANKLTSEEPKVKTIVKVRRASVKRDKSTTKVATNQEQENTQLKVKEGINRATLPSVTIAKSKDEEDKNNNNNTNDVSASKANNSNKDATTTTTTRLTSLVTEAQPKQLKIDGSDHCRNNAAAAASSPSAHDKTPLEDNINAAIVSKIILIASSASPLLATKANGHDIRINDKLVELVGETIVIGTNDSDNKLTEDTLKDKVTSKGKAESQLAPNVDKRIASSESKEPIHQSTGDLIIPALKNSGTNTFITQQAPSNVAQQVVIAANAAIGIDAVASKDDNAAVPQIAQQKALSVSATTPTTHSTTTTTKQVAAEKEATKDEAAAQNTNSVAKHITPDTSTASNKECEAASQKSSEDSKLTALNAMPELQVATGPVQPVKLGVDGITSELEPFDVPSQTQTEDGFQTQKKKILVKKLVRKNSIDRTATAVVEKEKAVADKLSNLLKDKHKISGMAATLNKAAPPKKILEKKPSVESKVQAPTEKVTTTAEEGLQLEITVGEEETAVESEQSEIVPVPKKPRKIKKKVIIKRQKRRLSISDTFFTQPEEEPKVPEIETIEKAISYVTDDESNENEKDNAPTETSKDEVDKPPLKTCLRCREYQVGDAVMYAERFKKTQVRWKRGRVLERITSISYKLEIEGKEVPAHISYIKKWTGRKVNFGGKEYLEIDYEQVAEEERRARSYSIWNMV